METARDIQFKTRLSNFRVTHGSIFGPIKVTITINDTFDNYLSVILLRLGFLI